MNQDSEALFIEIGASDIKRIAKGLQDHYAAEEHKEYPLWALSRAVRSWLVRRADSFTEDVVDRLTTPGRDEAREFKSLLNESLENAQTAKNAAAATPDSSVFTGFRPFSHERLGAMALYIAEKGKDIYKTKLNKLLFYSDFINFHLYGHSISGAKYIHVPFGPVPEQYGTALEQLAKAGRVKLLPAGRQSFLLKPTDSHDEKFELEPEELATIDWVLEKYGSLSSVEISELSHNEKAYKYTRPGEEIAYRYAAFFENLPKKLND
jgi:uncharacterized phage-associated protein